MIQSLHLNKALRHLIVTAWDKTNSTYFSCWQFYQEFVAKTEALFLSNTARFKLLPVLITLIVHDFSRLKSVPLALKSELAGLKAHSELSHASIALNKWFSLVKMSPSVLPPAGTCTFSAHVFLKIWFSIYSKWAVCWTVNVCLNFTECCSHPDTGNWV